MENKTAGVQHQDSRLSDPNGTFSFEVPKEKDSQYDESFDARASQYTLERFIKRSNASTLIPQSTSRNITQECNCPKILIVEDDMFNLITMETLLMSLNQKADVAYDGKSAIEKLLNRQRYPCLHGTNNYNLVILDYEMPVMNGPEAARHIRDLQHAGILPWCYLVGCTAHQGKSEKKEFEESGVDECLKKPVSKPSVALLIDKYVNI